MHIDLGIGEWDYQGYLPPEILEEFEEDEDVIKTRKLKKIVLKNDKNK